MGRRSSSPAATGPASRRCWRRCRASCGLTGGRIGLAGIGDEARQARLHHLGHREALKGALTALENLQDAAAILGERRLAPLDALREVGLPGAAGIPAAYLSAGQRRRITLARLLVAHRPLWLLDEPTTALDHDGQVLLLRLIEAHRRAGGLVVAATHVPLALEDARDLRLGERVAGKAAA